ncbi:MAG: biopolymer transporter ExbD [Cellvibrionaceae bacterium]
MRFKRHHKREAAELEITSFMNLMIILVPVLLVMMVFSRITVVDLKLPDLGDPSQQDLETQRVEVVLEETFIDVNRVFGNNVTRYNRIVKKDNQHDFKTLSLTLQQLKREFRDRGLEKRDALILSRPETDYQALITTIDTVRSYKAVVVTDVVDAELFPEIALGDAPVQNNGRGL